MITAYQAVLTGAQPPDTLPDISQTIPESEWADTSIRPKPGLDGRGIMVHICRHCHNSDLDQTISRSQFNVDLLDLLPRGVKDRAIDRLLRPDDDRRKMPPTRFHDLTDIERDLVIAELTAPFDGETRGGDAIMALFKRMLDQCDRRFDRRIPKLAGWPRSRGGEVTMRWKARYVAGTEHADLTGVSVCRFEAGRIKSLHDTMLTDEIENMIALCERAGKPSPTAYAQWRGTAARDRHQIVETPPNARIRLSAVTSVASWCSAVATMRRSAGSS